MKRKNGSSGSLKLNSKWLHMRHIATCYLEFTRGRIIKESFSEKENNERSLYVRTESITSCILPSLDIMKNVECRWYCSSPDMGTLL